MNLVEKRVYFARVGLFCHNFHEESGLFGNGNRILTGCPLMFDHSEQGWSIFHVLDASKMYVRVPDYLVEDEILERYPGNCECVLDQEELDHYHKYNLTIEEENGKTS